MPKRNSSKSSNKRTSGRASRALIRGLTTRMLNMDIKTHRVPNDPVNVTQSISGEQLFGCTLTLPAATKSRPVSIKMLRDAIGFGVCMTRLSMRELRIYSKAAFSVLWNSTQKEVSDAPGMGTNALARIGIIPTLSDRQKWYDILDETTLFTIQFAAGLVEEMGVLVQVKFAYTFEWDTDPE